MSMAEDLRTFLLQDSTLGGLIGTKIYPIVLPQDPIFPAITYQWISGDRLYSLSGPSGLSGPRIQFDCWAKTYAASEGLFEALRKRLDGYRGQMGSAPGHTVQGVFFANEVDLYEAEIDVYRRSVDFMIHYEEAII